MHKCSLPEGLDWQRSSDHRRWIADLRSTALHARLQAAAEGQPEHHAGRQSVPSGAG